MYNGWSKPSWAQFGELAWINITALIPTDDQQGNVSRHNVHEQKNHQLRRAAWESSAIHVWSRIATYHRPPAFAGYLAHQTYGRR